VTQQLGNFGQGRTLAQQLGRHGVPQAMRSVRGKASTVARRTYQPTNRLA
jgi:hypothetical protein